MKKAYVVKIPVKIASIPQVEEKIQSGMKILKKYLTSDGKKISKRIMLPLDIDVESFAKQLGLSVSQTLLLSLLIGDAGSKSTSLSQIESIVAVITGGGAVSEAEKLKAYIKAANYITLKNNSDILSIMKEVRELSMSPEQRYDTTALWRSSIITLITPYFSSDVINSISEPYGVLNMLYASKAVVLYSEVGGKLET